jgi:hypothetical protein
MFHRYAIKGGAELAAEKFTANLQALEDKERVPTPVIIITFTIIAITIIIITIVTITITITTATMTDADRSARPPSGPRASRGTVSSNAPSTRCRRKVQAFSYSSSQI